jgi:hypothetical protein
MRLSKCAAHQPNAWTVGSLWLATVPDDQLAVNSHNIQHTTPHNGCVSREEYEIQFDDIFDQIVAYAAGKPANVVNPNGATFDHVRRGARLHGGPDTPPCWVKDEQICWLCPIENGVKEAPGHASI